MVCSSVLLFQVAEGVIPHVCNRGGHRSGMPEATLAGFCIFLSDLDTDPDSLFNCRSSRSLRGHFISKSIDTFWLDHEW